jgi:hypothetical protein
MPDDDADDGEKHSATTVPPPAGESDIYEAKTQVGGLPPEAMELLRQMKEEMPSSHRGAQANVPVFIEDEPPSGKLRPAAGARAPAPPAPQRPPPAPEPAIEPVFAPKPEAAAARPPPKPLPDPESYQALFAPLPPSTANPGVAAPPEAPPPAPAAGRSLIPFYVVGAILVLGFTLVFMAQAGLIPGLHRVGTP